LNSIVEFQPQAEMDIFLGYFRKTNLDLNASKAKELVTDSPPGELIRSRTIERVQT